MRRAVRLPAVIEIKAREPWNKTGVHVRPGERYLLAASGSWTDFFIRTDADGYETDDAPRPVRAFLRRFESRRRMPGERWFCLIGAVGRGGTPFRIGTGREWDVPSQEEGELLCFANDVPSAYWNNFGAVRLIVERRA